jgi:hypothetical protein
LAQPTAAGRRRLNSGVRGIAAMAVNWDLVLKIVIPLGALLLGKLLDQWFGKRPKLITYLGHTSSFTLASANNTKVHTHAIVIRNTGRATANNVRVGHNVLPDVQVYPDVPYTKEVTPGGGTEIVFPKLVPDEQVTINYLYFPPLIWSQINTYAKCDEASAKYLSVIPSPQHSKLTNFAIGTVLLIGSTTLLYLIISLAIWLY